MGNGSRFAYCWGSDVMDINASIADVEMRALSNNMDAKGLIDMD